MAIIPDNKILGRTNQEKLNDTVWGVRSMGATIPRYGADGRQNGETSPNIEAAWNAANFANVNGKLEAVLEAVKQLASAQGVTIDLDAIEAAAERGAEKALAEGIVKVDVTVQGQENNNG